ncbi:glycosyltransferase family 4 protein [Nocardioides sp. CN2-186]|uniref:glycosyltransferase n=1 Tax=Nocardioides tweenelious TaxID=3156607 RepID=UPI0032B42A33
MASYNLLVFSLCLPFEGIDHAGGEYVLRSVRAVASDANVSVVSIDSPRNRHAISVGELDYEPFLLGFGRLFGSYLFRLVRKVQNRVAPLTLPVGIRASIKKSDALKALVAAADVIEFQWVEMACIRRHLPSSAHQKRTVVVAHDVLTQRYARKLAAVSIVSRPFHLARYKFVKSRESRLLRGVDVVMTFSDKDAALVRELAPDRTVSVVFPPLYEPGMDAPRRATPGRAIFVATFVRHENIDAADWLLARIWPLVLQDVPDAELVLVGAGSDRYLNNTATHLRKGVSATGYLRHLDAQYRSASVALVPMRLGAGVKFKTLTAMLWGIPVVATPVGAEGIGSEVLYAGLKSDQDEFARAVKDVLITPREYERKAESAQAWARRLAGPERFRASILAAHCPDVD